MAKAKMKKSVIPAVLALAVIALLVLLLLACGLIAFLYFSPLETPEGGTGNGGPETGGQLGGGAGAGGNATPPANMTNLSQEDLELWNDITEQNVESACLKRAKEEAGSSAGLVYSCDCEEAAGAARKTYSCDIGTADPLTRYFVNIDCFLEGRACTVESNYGTETVTFGELGAWYEE
jgi:hypothetical protein